METQDLRNRIEEFTKTAIVSDSVTNGRRLYVTPDGKKYPSVTTVLSAMEDKTWLKKWQDRVGEEEAARITKQATSRGTSMHTLIENHFRGETIDREASGYSLFKKLRVYLQNIDPLGLEVPLWSDTLRVAGRTDCIGFYKGELSIIDYKTSRREKQATQITNYFHQSTIYSMMLLERLDLVAKKIVILIGVDDGFPQEFIRPTQSYIKDCLRIVKAYHELHSS